MQRGKHDDEEETGRGNDDSREASGVGKRERKIDAFSDSGCEAREAKRKEGSRAGKYRKRAL